jgi:hypothetical protein
VSRKFYFRVAFAEGLFSILNFIKLSKLLSFAHPGNLILLGYGFAKHQINVFIKIHA